MAEQPDRPSDAGVLFAGAAAVIAGDSGNLSLYWVKGADSFLYEKALPASEAARQLSQSATSLAENAQRLAQLPMKSSVNIWGAACLLRAIACWRR